jgi:hypothetical protein
LSLYSKFKNKLIKMKKLTLSIACLTLLSAFSANATTVTFTAQAGAGVTNLAGAALTGTAVEVGYYDSGVFTSVGDAGLTGTPAPGLFGDSTIFNSNPLTAFQPALRIFSTDGGSAIAYSSAWTFSAGDGGGTDTGSDAFELADVFIVGALTGTGSVFASAGSQFSLAGDPVGAFGATPSLEIGLAIPEPSTYAALAGLCALSFVMVRRRRA